MKKIFKATFAASVIAAVGMVSMKTYERCNNSDESDNSLISENVLALAQSEGGTLTRRFRSGTKLKVDYVTVGFPEMISVSFRFIKCCLSSDPIDGCDFSLQDKDC